jgi:hypothetical protein
MLTEDQAKAASEALLNEPRKLQAQRAEKIDAARSRPPSPPVKWQVICGFLGLAVGTLLEYFISRNVTFWGIAGASVGWMAGLLLDSRREA